MMASAKLNSDAWLCMLKKFKLLLRTWKKRKHFKKDKNEVAILRSISSIFFFPFFSIVINNSEIRMKKWIKWEKTCKYLLIQIQIRIITVWWSPLCVFFFSSSPSSFDFIYFSVSKWKIYFCIEEEFVFVIFHNISWHWAQVFVNIIRLVLIRSMKYWMWSTRNNLFLNNHAPSKSNEINQEKGSSSI